ncbi:MAG TPA: AMP-binding protein [Desulfomonilia bacterium]
MNDAYSKKPWISSYDKEVPESLEYPDVSYQDFIRDAFDKMPDRAALHYMGRMFSYRELDNLSNRFAHFLEEEGSAPGNFIAVHTPNIPACYISLVGIEKAGCIYQGVSPLLTPEELEYQLNDSGAKIIVTLDLLFSRVAAVAVKTSIKTIVVTSIADYLPLFKKIPGLLMKKIPTAPVSDMPGIRVERFTKSIQGKPENFVNRKADPSSPCVMVYTGGTTGNPKGALLSHKNLVRHIIQNQVWYGFRKGGETLICPYPMFHMAGCFITMTSIALGCTYVMVPNPRDMEFMVSAIRRYNPSAILAVPTIYLEMMKLPEFRNANFKGIKYFISGSAPFPAENIKEFETLTGGKLIETYGLTETTTCIAAPPFNGVKKVGSVGIPFMDTGVKIVDPDTGEPVPMGEPGEITVSGPQVFSGYHNQPEETANVLKDGWFRTGDVGIMDDQGYLSIVDRIKDMVNVSGFKVFTRVVDEVLVEHPDIAMAATVGLPDEKRPGSEIVASAVVLKPGVKGSDQLKTDILSYLQKRLAPYKIPKKIEFFDQLPLSNVGKVLKKDLRKVLGG